MTFRLAFVCTLKPGPSTCLPAESAHILPPAVRTRNGAAEAIVSEPLPAPSRTRTFASGASPIVVPR